MNHRQSTARTVASGVPRLFAGLLVACGLLFAADAHAIRPFVTDDARVVGDRLAQLETWMLLDRSVLEHNVFVALGPHPRVELTLGLLHGGVHSGRERSYSLTGPVVQGKFLLLEAKNNRWPGIAVAGGVLPPVGYGPFTPVGWGGFGYGALTESLFDERLLIHANVGLAVGDDGPQSAQLGFTTPSRTRIRTLLTIGIGAQARLFAGLHLVAEVYHGDPYDPRTDFPATQAGFRYIFSERVQVDSTFGTTLVAVESADRSARTEQWGTLGLRLVTSELW